MKTFQLNLVTDTKMRSGQKKNKCNQIKMHKNKKTDRKKEITIFDDIHFQ